MGTLSFTLEFLVLPLALPLIISILILGRNWGDQVVRFVGLFILQFVIAYIIHYFYFMSWPIIDGGGRPYFRAAVFSVAPAFVMAFVMLYFYIDLFANWWAWLLLASDFLYWFNTILIYGDFVLDYPRLFSLAIMFLFPSIYSILSWVFVRKYFYSAKSNYYDERNQRAGKL